MLMDVVNSVVARSDVNRILEEVMNKCTWISSLREVWRLLQDDRPLQEAILKKIARQELEMKNAYVECEKNDRLESVSNLKRKERTEKMMVDLGEMMICLDITMMKELEVDEVNE